MTNIERVGTGDPSRHVGKRPDGFSQYFQTHHRGKRSIAVNLREPEGRERGRRGDVADRIAQDQPIRSVAAPDSDQTGGIISAFAIASALVARERTGEPQRVETSLCGSQIWGRAPAINTVANAEDNATPLSARQPIANMFTLQAQGADEIRLFVG